MKQSRPKNRVGEDIFQHVLERCYRVSLLQKQLDSATLELQLILSVALAKGEAK